MEINWLFAVVVALFAILIINGYSKGFLRIVVSFMGTIVVMIAVIVISPRVSGYILNNTDIYEHTRQKVVDVFLDKMYSDSGDTVDTTDALNDLNIPDILKNDFIEKNASEMYQALLKTLFDEYISGYIARLIIKAGSFVGVYLLLTIALWILAKSTDIIGRIPVIKGFNKFLGLLVGGVEALIIVWISFFVIIMFLGNELGGKLLSSVQSSVFLTFLFNNNVLFRFISN